MKHSQTILAGVVALAILSLFSCSREETAEPVVQNDMAVLLDRELKEEVIIEEIIDDVLNDLEQFDFKKAVGTCPIITVEKPEDVRFPKVITRDFGDGCVNEWGVEKRGKVIVTLYGPWLREGSKRVVEFEDYTHRGTAVSGRKIIVCEGVNADSLFVHSIRGKIQLTSEDSMIVKREINQHRTMLAGFREPDAPKEWLLEGSVKVATSSGRDYLMNIRDPLHRIQGCRWAQSGVKVIRFNLDSDESREYTHKVVIDYSYVGQEDSRCDSFVMRSVDDQEPEVVNLRR